MRGYTARMIRSFRHKGLRLLYEKGDESRLPADQLGKIERILARLDQASLPSHMDLPGYRLHPLKGELAGFWAVSVTGNWRVIFQMTEGHVTEVDLVDYH